MRRLVELAAATLPWAIRDRYREEWLHDLEHAAEAGVRRGDIAWGAVRTAITVDRLQAPSTAHAILQARLRIDSAGMHASIAALQLFVVFTTWPQTGPVIGLLIVLPVLAHSAVLVMQLHLAWSIVGGRTRWAAALWLAGLAFAAVAAAWALTDDERWTWVAIPAGLCIGLSSSFAQSSKPPKPELEERVRPRARRRLLLLASAIGGATVVVAAIDALVLLPLRWTEAGSLTDAWHAIDRSTALTPLAASASLILSMAVPIAVGLLGASRWARSERGILGWAAAGSLLGVVVALINTTAAAANLPALAGHAAPMATLLPLLAAVLFECWGRANGDAAPLPPASMPIPEGPWHLHGQPLAAPGTEPERR